VSLSKTEIVALTPPHPAMQVNVSVTNPDGSKAETWWQKPFTFSSVTARCDSFELKTSQQVLTSGLWWLGVRKTRAIR
jgi:hypothetical protein